MVNQSKAQDPRFWKKWQESGAVGTIHSAYEMLMAPMRANEREVEKRVQEHQPLMGIEKALEDGCKIHGFRSGGGLRVVRIEQAGILKGYGEHPSADHALHHANEDFLAGGREYNDVYDKQHLHYLTGSTEMTSPLDGWLRRGNTFDASKISGQVVLELFGYAHTEAPNEVIKKVDETGQPVTWTNRGYTYETKASRFPNDEPCHSTSIIKSPTEKEDGADPWMYEIVKTGTGKKLSEALENAFKAKEVEVTKEAV